VLGFSRHQHLNVELGEPLDHHLKKGSGRLFICSFVRDVEEMDLRRR
jgi:hypothetical protein